MGSNDKLIAESAWLYRLFALFAGCLARVSLTGGTIRTERILGDTHEIPINVLESIAARPSWFWHRLTIRLVDGTERSIGGLDAREAELIRDAVIEKAIRVAQVMSLRLKQLDERLRQLLGGSRYVRYSDSRKFHRDIELALRECKGLVRKYFEPEAREAFGRLESLEPVEGFEAARTNGNDLFVSNNVPAVQAAARAALGNPLTNEQAEAIATDEEVTLVLAGAGTGKTSVIVGKVAHLVRNMGVSPDEVLVLAFNHKAADELSRRLRQVDYGAHGRTFHKFGLSVIDDVEKAKPTVVGESELRGTIEKIFEELLNDRRHSDSTFDFIASYYGAFKAFFDFDNQDDYDAYMHSREFVTLSGVQVKSLAELEIANYFTRHDVKFHYEHPYEFRTKTHGYGQYHPDFFLPDYDIYIEHYALDKRGNPQRGLEGYKGRVEWHRRTHKEYGTKLIETFSWQHRDGILLRELRSRLEIEGVRFERIPLRYLVPDLLHQLIQWLARLLAKFLNHFKTTGMSSRELRDRANKQDMPWRNRKFLKAFEQVRIRYEQRLKAEGKVDFHDMINRAAQYIRDGKWESPYRYMLVDEFQDISVGRMKLLEALRRDGTAYFLVGDDWQAINGFAGSDVRLVRNCGDYLGHVQQCTLSGTFRFGDGILKPSTRFVRRNPEQTQRRLESMNGAKDKGITIVADEDPVTGLQCAQEEIKSYAQGKNSSVLVLGRYRKSKNYLLQSKPQGEEFSTVHAAKGREADYVVVLDLKEEGRWGFPSRIEDDPLFQLVLPPVSEKAYPFAEERRLFYVAMTRARIGAYLVTDPMQPSTFVTELLRDYPDLRQIGALARECPRCRKGRLRVKNGKYGPFLGCTRYESEPSCRYTKNIETAKDT